MILAVIVVVATAETALARPKKHRVDRGSAKKERAERPSTIPRGSGTSMPPVPACRRQSCPSPLRVSANRRQLNCFSDRVTQRIHSFPLNAGLGNNPNKDFYVGPGANN
jgi:hypothetical protein